MKFEETVHFLGVQNHAVQNLGGSLRHPGFVFISKGRLPELVEQQHVKLLS
jgi:hypothetical protein